MAPGHLTFMWLAARPWTFLCLRRGVLVARAPIQAHARLSIARVLTCLCLPLLSLTFWSRAYSGTPWLMRMLRVLVSAIAVLASAACIRTAADTPAAARQTPDDVERLMAGTIEPAARSIWQSVSTTVSIEGVDERFPRNDREWAAVRSHARTLVESGKFLRGTARSDTSAWADMARALIAAAEETIKATEAKRPEGIIESGEKIYNACTGCHQRYPGRMQNQ